MCEYTTFLIIMFLSKN